MSYLDNRIPPEPCALCGRPTPDRYAERHHLIPDCKGGKERIRFCIDCGNQVHELFTIPQLANKYNTLEALKSDDRIQKWVLWIQKRPNSFGICMKSKKRRL